MRLALLLCCSSLLLAAAPPARHIVLVAGDEEYRSEESLPMLARILETRHGFRTTVLYSLDKKDGTINPNQNDNQPGLEALASADLLVLALRWRDLPDDQMRHIVAYIESGKPVIGLRTATHCFNLKTSPTYQRWNWNSQEWDGGFGRQILGETWINHHGKHGSQSTRARLAPGAVAHPVLRGIADSAIWGPTDVYTVRLPLPENTTPLLLGEVLDGMTADSPAAVGEKNAPMLPVAWVRQLGTRRVFTTTMGAAADFENEALRRLFVNAVYWTLGLEVPARADARTVGEFHASPFGFNKFTPGRRPAR
jgi:type 1 glutamine amidotransferase